MVSCFYETKAPVQLQWLTVNKEVRVSNFLYCCCLFPVIKDSCKKQHFYFLFLLLNIFLPPYFFHLLLLLLLLLLVLLFFSLSLLYNSLKVIRCYQPYHCLSATFSDFYLVLVGLDSILIHLDFILFPFVVLFSFFFSVWRPCTMCRPRRVKIPTTSSKSCAAPSWAKESPSNRKGTSTFDFQSHLFIRNRSPSHFIRSPRFSWNGIIKPKFS